MAIEADDIEEMLARVRAREDKAKAELAEAESKTERDEIRERLEALEARNQELEAQLKAAEAEPEPKPDDDDGDERTPVAAEERPKMRRGRKHGMVYQDGKGEPAYVYDGPDEDDLVPVDEEDAA